MITMFTSTSRTKLPITFTIVGSGVAGVDGPGVTFTQYLLEVPRYCAAVFCKCAF